VYRLAKREVLPSVRLALCCIYCISGITFGQQSSHGQVRVLTVCEVLGGVDDYADIAAAVAGRMERSVSLADHYEFLSQDRCEHPVYTHGHAWSNRIQIWTAWEEGMPKAPSDRPNLEPEVVAAKLAIIRKTTKLVLTTSRVSQQTGT
jgi:hypothetical protein